MEPLNQVARWLGSAQSVLFITGAGVSADSGLPTYRGVGGLYEGAGTDEGLSIEEALSGSVFRRDPALSWKYIAEIVRGCEGAQPNQAHRVMALAERKLPRAVVLTQNVDGLHRTAGSRSLIPIHGDLSTLRCTQCAWQVTGPICVPPELPPRCPVCQGVVRPDVVLFEEQLPAAALRELDAQLHLRFDLVFSVGTSSLFPYIAEPVRLAKRWGVPAVEINPEDTIVSPWCDVQLRMGAAPAMGALAGLLGWRA